MISLLKTIVVCTTIIVCLSMIMSNGRDNR
jgi:hypothetical protein